MPEGGEFFCCHSVPGKNHEIKNVDRHFFEHISGVLIRFAPPETGGSFNVKLRRLGMPFDWNLYDHYFTDPEKTQQPIGQVTRPGLQTFSNCHPKSGEVYGVNAPFLVAMEW